MKAEIASRVREFLGPQNYTLQGSDFRKWNSIEDICSIVSIAERSTGALSVEIGFCSPVLADFLGLSLHSNPSIADCNAAGFRFSLQDLSAEKLQIGWSIEDKGEQNDLLLRIDQLLEDNFYILTGLFFTLQGWKNYCYSQLVSAPARRGWWWSVIGYILLSEEKFDHQEFDRVIRCHSRETKRSGKIELHLNRQKKLAKEK